MFLDDFMLEFISSDTGAMSDPDAKVHDLEYRLMQLECRISEMTDLSKESEQVLRNLIHSIWQAIIALKQERDDALSTAGVLQGTREVDRAMKIRISGFKLFDPQIDAIEDPVAKTPLARFRSMTLRRGEILDGREWITPTPVLSEDGIGSVDNDGNLFEDLSQTPLAPQSGSASMHDLEHNNNVVPANVQSTSIGTATPDIRTVIPS